MTDYFSEDNETEQIGCKNNVEDDRKLYSEMRAGKIRRF